MTSRPRRSTDNPAAAPMVSHPEPTTPTTIADRDRSLTVRPPTSVASSRHAHSQSRSQHHQQRRHRHSGGRSHHGGSSHQPLNEFPVFSTTGDVEIVIRVEGAASGAGSGKERRYLLHRLILAQNSGFFDAGTSEEWPRQRDENGSRGDRQIGEDDGDKELAVIREDDGSRAVGYPAGSGSKKSRWRYELDWEDREQDELPILVQKSGGSILDIPGQPSVANNAYRESRHPPPPTRNKPPPPQQGFFRTMAGLTGIKSALHLPSTVGMEEPPIDPTIRDYDNLFRIFYNYPPHLNSVNIASAYAECKALLNIADMYDALPVVGPRVDHHLLRFSSRLYKQIAKYPPSYLKLGYLARSRVIFAEALIHVVGQWPAALPHLGPNSYSPLPDPVLDLLEDKVDDLDDAISRIEGKLFRLSLTTSRGERVNPSNAYLDWLAVSLFRQWLVENTTPPPPSILRNNNNPPSQSRSTNSNHRHTHSSGSTGSNTTRQTTSTSAHTSTSAGAGSRSTSTSTPSSPPPFSLGRTYRLLGSPNSQAYLTRDDLKRFLKLHPSSDLYSRDNLKRLERKMEEIKRLAREIVRPLMRNFLELDLRGPGGEGDDGAMHGTLLPYLTCTRVEEGDFPWD